MGKNDLDDISRRVLYALAESDDEEMTVPALAEQVGVEPPKVHYRVENKLTDYTEKRGTEPRPGSTRDATVIGLTEDGKTALSEIDTKYPATMDEVIDWAQDADTRLSAASEDAEKALETARDAHQTAEGIKGGLASMFSDEIDELEEQLRLRLSETVNTKLENFGFTDPVEQDIATGSEVKDVRDQLDSLRRELNELGELHLDDRDELAGRIDSMEGRLDRLEENHESLSRRLEAVENRTLLDLIIGRR